MAEYKDNDINNDVDNNIDNNNMIKNVADNDNSNVNRPLIVGPCFCGKSYLMIKKIPLSLCDNPDRQTKVQLDLLINILVMKHLMTVCL